MASNPTASGKTVTKAPGESTPLTSLFVYSDLDNDIVRFAVKDRELGGGYLTRNGVKQTEAALFDNIPIGEIGLWAFVAGPSGSTSTIGFNAIDSRGAFNPSVTATVSVPAAVPHDPTASGKSVTKAAGESTPLTSLFVYSDQDNDIVSFAVKDRELGGGYLTKNGIKQTENALFDNIPIGEIGKWAFVAGPEGSASTIGFNAIDSRGKFNATVTSTVTVPVTTPKVTVADANATEGGTLVFTFSLDRAATQDVTVNFKTLDGTATLANSDYAGKSGFAVIKAGTLTATGTVQTNQDSTYEPNETLQLQITSVSGGNAVLGAKTVATGTIVNDDSFPIATAFRHPLGNGTIWTEATDSKDGYFDAQDIGGTLVKKSGETVYHLGEDWNGGGANKSGDGDANDPVYAAGNGVVLFAGNGGTGWAGVVIIQHKLPDGSFVSTLYGHLHLTTDGKIDVGTGPTLNVGEGVKIGQQLGKLATGNEFSTAADPEFAHLHFEVRVGTNGTVGGGYSSTPMPAGWVDPTDFLTVYQNPTGRPPVANFIMGTDSNDTKVGSASADVLDGHGGNDTLTGGAGPDWLFGGAGNDHFVFTARTDGRDELVDFATGDRLDFARAAFGSGLASGGASTGMLDPSHFVANTTGPATKAQNFWFNTTDHVLYFDPDGAGGSAPAPIVHLQNTYVLHNTDLFLI